MKHPPQIRLRAYDSTNSFFKIWTDLNLRGAWDKFPDFFRMDTFIDSTHMKL